MYMQKITRKKKYISFVLLLCLCLCQIQDTAINTVTAAEYAEPAATVQELDLGDYQSQMAVGEKQLLSVTILPAEASGQEVV